MHTLGEKEPVTTHYSSGSIDLVRDAALNCKTLEGFAGVMRRYCPDRRGPIFSEVFLQLLESYDERAEDDTVSRATKREKFMALLKNQITTTASTKVIYADMDQGHSLPPLDERLISLRQFIYDKEVEEVKLEYRGRLVVYCRKTLTADLQCSRKRNYRYFLHPSYDDLS